MTRSPRSARHPIDVHWLALALWLLALFCAVRAGAAPGVGAGIPIVVLVDDGNEQSMRRANGIVQSALLEIRDQLTRYGFTVVSEETMAARLDWDLSGRRGRTDLMRMVDAAKESRHPELDVRAIVIFDVLGVVKDRGFASDLRITIGGSIHDADARRQLSRFGPYRKRLAAPAHCSAACLQDAGRPLATAIAAIVGDEARRELARLTREGSGERVGVAPSTRGRGPLEVDGDGGDTAAGLVTTYAIHFENFSTLDVLEIINTMEAEFPGFVRSLDIQGTPRHGTYGYVSRASGSNMVEWMSILLMDMGFGLERDVQLIKDGTHIRLQRLGRGARHRLGRVG